MPNQRKFITDKEIKFIDALNKELIQDVAAQLVYYYSIINDPNDDDVYGESVSKTIAPPIELYARVLFADPEQRIGEHGTDMFQQIEVYFHSTELDERGVKPRAGDFVEFANKFYEVVNLVTKKLPYGEQSKKLEYKAICNLAREHQFDFPKHEMQTISNKYSGSLDVDAPVEKTDALDQWSTPVVDTDDT